MNLAGLASRFATGTYAVTRRQSTFTATRGAVDPPTQSSLTITASVTPVRGADLQKIPEGRRTNETRTFFTTTQLFVGDPQSGYEADQIAVGSLVFELVHLERWDDPRSGGAMYKAIAVAA